MEEKKPFVGALRTPEEKTLFFHGAISPDGRRIVSTSRDETIRFWDISNLEERC